mmetsp:Transcript_35001/g.86918  ORF Transcript_35001/g.86918 Transcript_35001/m.86918 type:complete len:286 (+) Transcript_35001:72-929(+)
MNRVALSVVTSRQHRHTVHQCRAVLQKSTEHRPQGNKQIESHRNHEQCNRCTSQSPRAALTKGKRPDAESQHKSTVYAIHTDRHRAPATARTHTHTRTRTHGHIHALTQRHTPAHAHAENILQSSHPAPFAGHRNMQVTHKERTDDTNACRSDCPHSRLQKSLEAFRQLLDHRVRLLALLCLELELAGHRRVGFLECCDLGLHVLDHSHGAIQQLHQAHSLFFHFLFGLPLSLLRDNLREDGLHVSRHQAELHRPLFVFVGLQRQLREAARQRAEHRKAVHAEMC